MPPRPPPATLPPSAETAPALAPLADLLTRARGIEAAVFWHDGTGWPDEPQEVLEGEEVLFYAEGLLAEGFSLAWAAFADSPGGRPDHLRLWFREDGPADPPRAPPHWQPVAQGTSGA
jgi:hypothetical protein